MRESLENGDTFFIFFQKHCFLSHAATRAILVRDGGINRDCFRRSRRSLLDKPRRQ